MPTAKYINLYTREKSDDVSALAQSGIIFLGCAVFKICLVHLFNSGLLYHSGTFLSYFGFLIFPRFPIISPLKLIRTLASEK